ncbi:hypothetical protein K440DRAFT_191665 [Wilcoxina mikolae CBS 423.85]|nr:hypothetical protein K440DRAFT_191665 [Wilcoxina mikolae CBS 423.85]
MPCDNGSQVVGIVESREIMGRQWQVGRSTVMVVLLFKCRTSRIRVFVSSIGMKIGVSGIRPGDDKGAGGVETESTDVISSYSRHGASIHFSADVLWRKCVLQTCKCRIKREDSKINGLVLSWSLENAMWGWRLREALGCSLKSCFNLNTTACSAFVF